MTIIHQLDNIQISLLTGFLMTFAGCFIMTVSVMVGYAMGRNSAEKPLVTKEAEKVTDEVYTPDEPGNLISDAVNYGEEEPKPKRIATIRGV